MGRLGTPPVGPYAKWISPFLEISDGAFSLLNSVTRPRIEWPAGTARRVVFDLTLHAETTSIAARTALTYSLGLPGFALARVRLEQCIVSSYLMHAPSADGMEALLKHQPMQMDDVVRKYERHFGSELRKGPSLETTSPQAAFPQGKFKRKWTSLALHELAASRDKLLDVEPVLPWKLEDAYWPAYPLMSLAVHGASETVLWAGEFHRPSMRQEQQFVYLLPERARFAAATITKCDIVQCVEALAFLETADVTRFQSLVRAYEDEAKGDA